MSLLLLSACSSMSSQNDFHQNKAYQKRKSLKAAFFKNEGQNYSETQIKDLLEKKINLNKPLKIAVVKLGHEIQQTYMSGVTENRQLQQTATKENVKAFKSIMNQASRIKDISFVPNFMMPEEPSIRNLRDVAALMQANLLLVILSQTDADFDFHFHKKNEAKAQATLESIIVDVKTGVIPFTSIATGTALLNKDDSDFSNKEFRIRTIIAAEDNALSELAQDIGNYFK